MSSRITGWGIAVLLLCAAGGGARVRAEPLGRDEVPEPLRPWIDWALRAEPQAGCPFSLGSPGSRRCAWPGALGLEVGPAEARFAQDWQLYRSGWVPLPGSSELWPEEVYADGRVLAVTPQDGVPSVRLERGHHALRGRLRWSKPPEILPIPAETGIVELRSGGKLVPFPRREAPGQLWLGAGPAREAGENRMDVAVQRRLIDAVPLELETRIELRVSGASREIEIGGVLPEGFVAAALDAPLPARIDVDGVLRVALRPGTHAIRIQARQTARASEIACPEVRGSWDPEEIWVFEAQPDLRLAEVEGVASVDPQQTDLPPEWRGLPAYRLGPGARLQLVERRRGDADPSPDQLSLQRVLWLDFDGGAYTAQDHIAGTLSRSWRLETAPGSRLGRAAVWGEDRTISRSAADGGDGIELRSGRLDLLGDLRMERGSLRASGWSHDFDRVSTELRLPPGWQLLHAGGVDRVRNSWITRWALTDLFLVLVGALAVAQLFGAPAAALAFAAFALSFTEPGAPRLAWLIALAGIALQRVAPPGRFARASALLRWTGLLLLLVLALPFAIRQAQLALHPALELPGWGSDASSGSGGPVKVASVAPAPVPAPNASAAPMLERNGRANAPESPPQADPSLESRKRTRRLGFFEPSESAEASEDKAEGTRNRFAGTASSRSVVGLLAQGDPQALVSTGPGVPAWSWRSVQLDWPGPVRADERVALWLLPPWASSALGCLRVGLIAALFALLLGRGLRPAPKSRWPPLGSALAVLLGALGALGVPGAARAQFPSAEQLEELHQRLMELPRCAPQCAASPRLRLELEPGRMALRVRIDAAWPTAVPLPGSLRTWTPGRVVVDSGAVPAALARNPDGTLWLALPVGSHDVLLDGPLPDQEGLDLPLPLAAHRVEWSGRGWTVSGARDDRPTESLRLARTAAEPSRELAVSSSALPGFAEVERTLELGLTWTLVTHVTRLTPPGTPLMIEVPLLEGESVTSSNVEVADGRARISLGAQRGELQWTSILEPRESIELVAPASTRWREQWQLAAAPLWHVEAEGIPTDHARGNTDFRVRRWTPWPGERVSLRITRPAGAPGESLTFDHSELHGNPGRRSSDWLLRLQLRASRGQTHRVQLPLDAELTAVQIDGQEQPLRLEHGAVALPVHPGSQSVAIQWRLPRGAGSVFGTPAVNLGAASVNAEIAFLVPPDRWVLWTSGPRLGPAVLFWSLLGVVAGLAIALGRTQWTPLGPGAWFLLFVGLTQVPLMWGGVFAAWLLALGARGRVPPGGTYRFDAVQIGLALWTAVALAILLYAIQEGLLGQPEMQIQGNGSHGAQLRWYQDRAGAALPDAWVLWVPRWVYQLAMLAWSLWIAAALLRWLRWGWTCFSAGGLWRRPDRIRPPRA